MNDYLLEFKNRVIDHCHRTNSISTLDDGRYYYDSPTAGALSAAALRVIADELDRLNEPLDKAIEDYFKENPVPSEETDLFLP